MTEMKTVGQIAYEAFSGWGNEYIARVWEASSPQYKNAWEESARQVSAPMLKRIEELEKELAAWKSHAEFRQQNSV